LRIELQEGAVAALARRAISARLGRIGDTKQQAHHQIAPAAPKKCSAISAGLAVEKAGGLSPGHDLSQGGRDRLDADAFSVRATSARGTASAIAS